jgi:hypothetical protein
MWRHDGKTGMPPGLPPRQLPVRSERERTRDGGLALSQAFKSYSREAILNDGDNRATRKTLSTYGGFIRRFIELFGDLPIGDITREP